MLDSVRGNRTDCITKTRNDLVKRSKYFVAKSYLAKFFPYLFNRVHLRSVWWDKKQSYIVRNAKGIGLMPCCTIATQKNDVVRILFG